MKQKVFKHYRLFTAVLVIILFIFGFKAKDNKSSLNKPTTNDYFNYIAINEIKMWVSNNGVDCRDPMTSGGGFYWPGGENATISAIYTDGLVWGGIVDSIRANGNVYRSGLQAGKILPGGNADDPNLTKYRVFKILKGWENLPHSPIRDQYELDFNEWPVDDGAPWIDVNGDDVYTAGIDSPQYIGDETMWYVANDLDTSRSLFTYGSLPMGLEFQTTVWGYDKTNFLADVLFKKFIIINKSQNTIDSMYFSYWADDDLGNAGDDYAGCDSNLSLGYVYNGDNDDYGYYGTPPPAVGHLLLQGPVVPGSPGDSAFFGGNWIYGFNNLKMTSFSFYI